VDPVADLEFGLPKELSIGFRGEQFGETTEVGVGGLAQGLINPLGQVDLLAGEIGQGHESSP
jgi:hypothetical protein